MNELPYAEQFREFRRRHNLSEKQVGHLTGVDERKVRKWSSGESAIPLAVWRILKICMGELSAVELVASMPERDPRGRKLED